MKKAFLNWLTGMVGAVCLLSACHSAQTSKEEGKPALMWMDAEANFERFSNPDSIGFYLKKMKDLGFTHAVVDVLPITGEVLFDTERAPKMMEWGGYVRKDFDYLGTFISKAHELGLKVHASLNVFVAGHNYFNRGIVYTDHPEWVSIVYTPEGMKPITEEKHKYSAMVNPIHPGVQEHIIGILTDLTKAYPDLDGIVLDRVRYDGITADFSPLSKSKFEEYIGQTVERFPEDIFEWKKDGNNQEYIEKGKYFMKWIEWRSRNIYEFIALARRKVKAVNPNISFGTYTGAWYPSYYEVGVNFASRDYNPINDFDWATAEYYKTGYAELLDLYIAGNYYTDITIEESLKNKKTVWNETDSRGYQGTWYSVEGSCRKLRNIMKDNAFIGGILADQFYSKPQDLARSIEMNLKQSDGVMIFDIVHLIHKNMWKEVEEGMRVGGALKED